ncbi:MAG: hypothetical protein ACFFBP_21480 [Promethearchaeota archaeon]
MLFQTSDQFSLIILILVGLTLIALIIFIVNLIKELKKSAPEQLLLILLSGSLLVIFIPILLTLISSL